MICNGNCVFCDGCVKQTNFIFPEEESKKECSIKNNTEYEKGLVVTEPVIEYKVVKNIFGKDKVRRVK